jgi:hypothetical protein
LRDASLLALVGMPGMVSATNFEVEEALGGVSKNRVTMPYAFYNSNTDAAVAVARAQTGYIQPQFGLVVNAFASSNGSTQFFMQAANAQVPFMPRLFVNAWMFVADLGRDGQLPGWESQLS